MPFLKFLLGLVAVTLLHLAGVWLFADFPRTVDLFLVLVVMTALGARSITGLIAGVATGLVHDTLTGGPYGLYGFADTIVGYLTARVTQRVVIERTSGVVLLVVIATLAQQAILVGLTTLLLGAAGGPPLLWWGIKAAANGGVAMLVELSSGVAGRFRETRRRDRVRRLKLGG